MTWLRRLIAKRSGTEIPYAIAETIEVLWKETRPKLVRQSKINNGYEFVYTMPRDMTFEDFIRKEGNFKAATGCKIQFDIKGKSIIMKIFDGELPTKIKYSWNPGEYQNMHLPMPLGVDLDGVHVVDLAELPHLFLSGPTGGGKSMLTRSIATSLQIGSADKIFMIVVDYGEVDYLWLADKALLVTDVEKAFEVFGLLNEEMDRRKKLLVKNRVVKITELKEKIPFIVVLIDEFAETNQHQDSVKLIDRLLRVGRKTGIHIVAATQRLSHTTIKGAGDIKHNFPARLSFRCDSVNSRMILGDDCDLASKLPQIKGRAIFRYGEPVELQTFLIEPEQARELIHSIPTQKREVFHLEPTPPMLPAR